ncbi:hypothetical protein BU26DRAFT_572628 [Trematosphaeria pertusa]|uniref:Uncharacterized protein n=1 Tax=Trematosphaeria pertusa TaxID=390896 RepID=A0A6A6HRA9_9PLEO|nr:uncharacterized protein BU26DRAFT_572628 [Trematosphaeria pertusa]KAF2240694.1 hypothetical protein BU26DRAFT_572628 [Trematosphaeria pertusa]
MDRYRQKEYEDAIEKLQLAGYPRWEDFQTWCEMRFEPIQDTAEIEGISTSRACSRLDLVEPAETLYQKWEQLIANCLKELEKTLPPSLCWDEVYYPYNSSPTPVPYEGRRYRYRLRFNTDPTDNWLAPAPPADGEDDGSGSFDRAFLTLGLANDAEKDQFKGMQLGYLEYSDRAEKEDWKQTSIPVVLRSNLATTRSDGLYAINLLATVGGADRKVSGKKDLKDILADLDLKKRIWIPLDGGLDDNTPKIISRPETPIYRGMALPSGLVRWEDED